MKGCGAMKKTIGDKTGYSTKCCVCEHEFFAGISIGQRMVSLDFGAGECPKCNAFLNLTFVPKEEIMISKKHSDWVNEGRAERQISRDGE